MKYIIKTVSGISGVRRSSSFSYLFSDAWEDAFGPKPWTPYIKKIAKRAWVETSTDDGPVDYSGNDR